MNKEAITIQASIPEELIESIAVKVLEQLKPHMTANSKQEDSIIFNVKGLAEYLKVEENWIYQRTRHHEIPFIKKGKYCLFRKTAIDAWLNQDAIKPLSAFPNKKKPY